MNKIKNLSVIVSYYSKPFLGSCDTDLYGPGILYRPGTEEREITVFVPGLDPGTDLLAGLLIGPRYRVSDDWTEVYSELVDLADPELPLPGIKI